MSELESLVKMANQIADNFSFHEDAVDRTADHLRRFWAPSMRERLLEAVRDGEVQLKPVAENAIRQTAG